MSKELTEKLLEYVADHEPVDTYDLVAIFGEDHQKIVGALKSIESNGALLSSEQTTHKSWELTEEGRFVVENGSHEAVVFEAVPAAGIAQADLLKVWRRMMQLFFFFIDFSFFLFVGVALCQGRFQQSYVTGMDIFGKVGGRWGATDSSKSVCN